MSIFKKTFLRILSIGLLFVAMFSVLGTGLTANAQGIPSTDDLCGTSCPIFGEIPTATSREDFAAFILNIARFLTFIGGAISVLFFVYGGVLYITDNGSGSGAEKGKKVLISSVIGLVIIIVAYTVVGLVAGLTSSDLFGGL